MTIANTTAVVEAYLAAKAAWDAAEDLLKLAKADVVAAVGGYGFIEGTTSDIQVNVQARKTINEQRLMDLGLTKEQIEACKVEGKAYPVLLIKPKKKMAA